MKVRPSVLFRFVCFGALLACPAWLLLVYFPGWAFPYKTECDNIELRSDEPFDAGAAKVVLTTANAKLRRSPFFTPDVRCTVCICNHTWKRKLFFLKEPKAGGLHYYFSNTIFLSGARIAENRLVSPSGRLVAGDRTLDYFIVHELAHTMAERAVGVWHYHHLDDWIKEGYVDYVGRGSALKAVRNREGFLTNSPEMSFPAEAPYLRFNLMVAYYLERNGWDPLRLHTGLVSRADAEREVRMGLQAEANQSPEPSR